ncbi:hypothetical protein ACTI_71120 [Actinoplanes sp. OR16]|uniref:hypothetical protein n=1 Tax=Actinoplanes sp. OR16 TaxID=946334 RepID=UPI000F6E652C|nr:hypothetical protein [Actinoplanes sp. OR16]BBH70427.1 hypothetical protein ACTI_71120 [Actinoplanes sp. OR16]
MSMFVSYCQYQVYTGEGGDGLDIYTVGDELLHVGGPSECTGFTGVHTGEIDIRIVVSAAEPPLRGIDEWDAASETTLWAPSGTVTVLGLMAGPREGLTDVPLAGPGLARVRIYARNRIHESVRTGEDPPEQHEVHIWPVTEESGPRTLFDDGSRGPWPQKPAAAATWAISRLGPAADGEPRVTVVRSRDRPWTPPATIYAGDVEIHLRPAGDAYSFTWHPLAGSDSTALPDGEPGIVRVDVRNGKLILRHENVPASQAVLLGLIWDHLLDLPDGEPPAWEAPMRAAATEAARRAEEERRRRTEREAKAWGGTPPTDRLRGLRARAKQLATLDRALLDAVAALPPRQQRAVANRAARQALESAALDQVGWIAEALRAAESGDRPFTDQAEAFRRLFEDPAVPQTLLPGPSARILHQAVAFPALLALDERDDLAAAVEALYIAAQAAGTGFQDFLTGARHSLPAD